MPKNFLNVSWSTAVKVVILVVGLSVASVALARILPQKSDWANVYRPAALNLISGQSPYAVKLYVAPPWVLVPLIPLAILPERVGRVAIFWLAIASLAGLAKKNGASVWTIIALIVSYPVVYGLIYGQIDWLVMLGVLLPPWLGVALLLAKPQVGLGVALFTIYASWREGGLKKLIITVLPTVALVALAYLLFGPAIYSKSSLVLGDTNTSLWPRALPIGLIILIAAIRQNKKFLAFTAAPFLSPYMPAHSWAATLLGVTDDALYPVLIAICTWVIWALGGGAVDG